MRGGGGDLSRVKLNTRVFRCYIGIPTQQMMQILQQMTAVEASSWSKPPTAHCRCGYNIRALIFTATKKITCFFSKLSCLPSDHHLPPPPSVLFSPARSFRQQVQQLPAAVEPVRIPQDRQGARVGMLHAPLVFEGQARPAFRGEVHIQKNI